MVHVADPMYVLAIAALKELIAQKVCTSGSVDFTKGEIVLLYQWRKILRRGPWGRFLGKNKGNTQKEENPAGQAKTKTPHLAQALDPPLLSKRS